MKQKKSAIYSFATQLIAKNRGPKTVTLTTLNLLSSMFPKA